MTIYFLPKFNFYFVPDADTQTAGMALGYTQATWVVGGIDEVNAKIAEEQHAFLSTSSFLEHFSQVKSVGQTSEGFNIWQSCDVTTEPENTDTLYELFCDIQVGFKTATGTQAAIAILEDQKQEILNLAKLDVVVTLDSLPSPRKTPKV